jgi:hypothetical protein
MRKRRLSLSPGGKTLFGSRTRFKEAAIINTLRLLGLTFYDLTDCVAQLPSNISKELITRGLMIYFIENVTAGMIKIGFTGRLTKRLKALRGTTGENLRVIAVMEGDRRRESLLHWRFKHLQVDLEWFRPGDDLLAYIKENAKEWDGAKEEENREGWVHVRLGPKLKEKARIVHDMWSYRNMHRFNNFLCIMLSKALDYEIASFRQEAETLRLERKGRAESGEEDATSYPFYVDDFPFESDKKEP